MGESDLPEEDIEKNNLPLAIYRERLEQRVNLFTDFLNEQIKNLGSRGISSEETEYDTEMPISEIPVIREYVLISNVKSLFYNLFREYGLK